MKKFLPIIIGILVGTVLSGAMIAMDVQFVAYGEDPEGVEEPTNPNEPTFNLTNEQGNFFEWKDVFAGRDEASDLYHLLYLKIEEFPEEEAMEQVAQAYGLTTAEANAVINGSITPIIQTTAGVKGPSLTQERAYQIVLEVQNDFEDFFEVFQLKNEIDSAVSPSTLFSDGDVLNSGFDLVHDLSIMEEILFVQKSDVNIGARHPDELDSPYLPTPEEAKEDLYIPSTQDVAVLSAALAEDGAIIDADVEDGEILIGENGEAGIVVGDEVVEVEYLEEDVCRVDSPYAEFLDEPVELEEESATTEDNSGGEDGELVTLEEGLESGDGDTGSGGGSNADNPVTPEVLTTENLQPATPDKWRETWCPGIGGDTEGERYKESGNFDDGVGKVIESSGKAFASLGNAVDSVVSDTLKPALGGSAGAGILTDGFAAHVAVCLDVEVVWKTVYSFQPGDSCIKCEVDKINELMAKTLSHSLIPNKVTGNIFESAKCKQSYTALIDIQFITIASPIPTATKDDLIFGNNIYEEWNSFVENYRPALGIQPKFPADFLLEFKLNSAPAGITIGDILVDITTTNDRQQAEAAVQIDSKDTSVEGKNVKVFYQNVLSEARQMSAFFDVFNDLYDQIDVEACSEILKKECIQ